MRFLMVKYAIYLLSTIIVIWSMDSININGIFKKNKVVQARVFYIILCLVLIYLLSNFFLDFLYVKIF